MGKSRANLPNQSSQMWCCSLHLWKFAASTSGHRGGFLHPAMWPGSPKSAIRHDKWEAPIKISTMQQGWTLEVFVKFGRPQISLSKKIGIWIGQFGQTRVVRKLSYMILCLFVLADGCRVAANSMLLWYQFERFWLEEWKTTHVEVLQVQQANWKQSTITFLVAYCISFRMLLMIFLLKLWNDLVQCLVSLGIWIDKFCFKFLSWDPYRWVGFGHSHGH